MTSNLPPGPPPQGPPPQGPPPQGPPPSGPPPEMLDSSGGGRLPRERRPRRTGLLVGGGVALVAVVGAGAFGAAWWFSDGAQAAEALPAGTIGYVGVNLDPSGGQKVAALETLEKFPAIREEFGLDGPVADIDVKQTLVDYLAEQTDCAQVTEAADAFGDRAAFAAVDTGGEEPAPVFTIEVVDADAAGRALDDLATCTGSDPAEGGGGPAYVVSGDWMVLAETEETAQAVVDQTESDGSLADDADFQRWTGETGGDGVVTLYAAPEAGEYLAEAFGPGLEDSSDLLAPAVPEMSASAPALPSALSGAGRTAEDGVVGASAGLPSAATPAEALEDFAGAALTLRFDDGALEIEAAGEAAVFGGSDLLVTDRGADVVEELPADTVAAVGAGFEEGWFGAVLEQLETASEGLIDAEGLEELAGETGLTLPDDVETVVGDAAAVSLGSGFDVEELTGSADPADLPVALTVRGEEDDVQGVLDRLAEGPLGSEVGTVGVAGGDGLTAIGLDEDYLADVVAGGEGLGDSETYQRVVPDSDEAGSVVFVDLDQVSSIAGDSLLPLLGDDAPAVEDNLDPLRALGLSSWVDDDVAHLVLRVSTDD